MDSGTPLAIALDQNFPTPIIECVQPFVNGIVFTHVQKIHPRLGELDDWQLIVALYRRGYRALASNDYHMLEEPRVVTAAEKTRTSLILIESLGDDPVRATGTLLLDVAYIARHLSAAGCTIYKIKRNNPVPMTPAAIMQERAKKKGLDVRALRTQERLSGADLVDPLG